MELAPDYENPNKAFLHLFSNLTQPSEIINPIMTLRMYNGILTKDN